MKIESYKQLIVWQKSLRLVKEIYLLTSKYPSSEKYGLANQMRRAAVAIPSNIAEGSRRGSAKDYSNFLRIADGSTAELETQLIISKDLYPQLDYTLSIDLTVQVQKMLITMIKKISLRDS